MLPLRTQQAREPVALLLRPAAWENFVEIMIAALLRAPLLAEMLNHHAHLRLHAVLVVKIAQKTNDLPVLVGERQLLLLGERAHEVLGPIIEVDQITFGVGLDLLAVDVDRLDESFGKQHEYSFVRSRPSPQLRAESGLPRSPVGMDIPKNGDCIRRLRRFP